MKAFSSFFTGSGGAARSLVLASLLVLSMVGGASASDHSDFIRGYDGFEDGSSTDGSPLDWNDQGSVNSNVQSSVVKNGQYALEVQSSVGGNGSLAVRPNSSVQEGWIFQSWVYLTSGTQAAWTLTDDEFFGKNTIFWYADESQTDRGFFIQARDDTGGTTDSADFGNAQSNEWYLMEIEILDMNGNVTLRVYDSSKSLVGSVEVPYHGATDINNVVLSERNDAGSVYFDDVSYAAEPANIAPEFNSTTIQPDPPLIGEPVSYSASASDSDGSVSSLELTVFKDGSQVYQDSVGSSSYSWNDVFSPSSAGSLDARFTATDDAGATTTTWLNRTLTNDAPSVDLSMDSEQWSYDADYSFSVDASDSVPGEDIYCDINKDGGLVEEVYLMEGVNNSYSGSVRTDLGSHSLDVSCEDQDGNTGTDSQNYTIKAFELLSSSGDENVFETVNSSFSSQYKTGEMVSSLEARLFYDGEVVDSKSVSPSGVSSFTVFNDYEIPLVGINESVNDWKVIYEAEYTGFNGGAVSQSRKSSEFNQTVLWSYYLKESKTDPLDGDYIEGDNLQHSFTVHSETDKASVSGLTTYNRTGETSEMVLDSSNGVNQTWLGQLDVGRADSFNESTFGVNSELSVEFKNSSRKITTPVEDVNVHRIRLTDDSSESDTAEALTFNTFYEGSQGDSIQTDLFMDLTVSKNGIDRDVSYITEGKSSHKFYIRPSWGEYDIRTASDDLIQYEKSDGEGVLRSYFFPVREEISSSVTEVPLLNINKSETSRISFEVTDSSGAPADGVVCRVDRKFPGTGQSKTVFMIKTGSEGNTESFAEVNEIYYRFTCYEDGEVVDVLSDQIMNNPMRLRLGEEDRESSLNYNNEFDASCEVSGSDLECDYQSETDSLDSAVLQVERREVVANELVCDKNGLSRTGTLSCQGLNFSENTYEYIVEGEYSQGKVTGDSGVVGEVTGIQYGFMGIIATVLIYGFILVAAAKNLLIGVGVGTAWIMVSSILGFFPLNPEMRATLLAVTMVIAWVISK